MEGRLFLHLKWKGEISVEEPFQTAIVLFFFAYDGKDKTSVITDLRNSAERQAMNQFE